MFIHTVLFLTLALTSNLKAEFLGIRLATEAQPITIHPATLSDLENTLHHLVLSRTSPSQFDYTSGATQQLIIKALEDTYRPLIAQEIEFFKEKSSPKITLVAKHKETVVGFFSVQSIDLPNTLFIRWIVINQAYAKYNIFKLLLKETLKTAPQTETFVFLVNVHNEGAKRYYESLGAQQFSSAPWEKYLYAGLNKEDFIPYFISRDAFKKGIEQQG